MLSGEQEEAQVGLVEGKQSGEGERLAWEQGPSLCW